MSIVVDASITLAWIYPDERTPAVDSVFEAITRSGAVVPSLWHLEVANSLEVGLRAKRIDRTYRNSSLADLAQMDIRVDEETASRAWSGTLAIATRCGLTVYDAAYLELAVRRNLPLATLDKDMRRGAGLLGVETLGF